MLYDRKEHTEKGTVKPDFLDKARNAGFTANRGNAPGLLSDMVRKGGNWAALEYHLGNMGEKPSVVQRIVTVNLEEGTEVYIVRSTERRYHGSKGRIKKYLGNNVYEVQVGGKVLRARTDQLSRNLPKDSPMDVDVERMTSMSVEEIVEEVMATLRERCNIKKAVIGGSFAVMLNAFQAGKSARTPRDLDILVREEDIDLKYMGGDTRGNGVVETEEMVFGLPIELHIIGKSRGLGLGILPSEEEQKYSSADTLLVQEVRKLAAKARVFREYIERALKGMKTANVDGFLQSLHSHDGEVSENFARKIMERDIEPPKSSTFGKGLSVPTLKLGTIADDSAQLWAKTLADIETLFQSGASMAALIKIKGEFGA